MVNNGDFEVVDRLTVWDMHIRANGPENTKRTVGDQQSRKREIDFGGYRSKDRHVDIRSKDR